MPHELWYQDGLRFTCTRCGNCCTGPPGYVWFSPEEAKAIADHLKLPLERFYHEYARQINGRWSLKESRSRWGHDCVFLTRDEAGKAGCKIYSVRPQQCRTWPFWPENLENPRTWRNAQSRCPGVNNGKLFSVEQVRIIRDSHPTSPCP